MKKSPFIVLGLTLILAQACQPKPKEEEWVTGDKNSRDTVVHGSHYRSMHGMYYPVYGNRISPTSYQGSTARDIGSPSHTPTRRAGFGSSSHASARS